MRSRRCRGSIQFSLGHLLEEVQRAVDAGVIAIMLFGIPAKKDECGSEAYNDDGIIQQAVRLVRAHYPELVISTDVCMCEYTSHGHCGLIKARRWTMTARWNSWRRLL